LGFAGRVMQTSLTDRTRTGCSRLVPACPRPTQSLSLDSHCPCAVAARQVAGDSIDSAQLLRALKTRLNVPHGVSLEYGLPPGKGALDQTEPMRSATILKTKTVGSDENLGFRESLHTLSYKTEPLKGSSMCVHAARARAVHERLLLK
jgi:hypothetical protein